MGFWGIEVKPGNPFPYHSGNVPGKLRITQATLGTGSSKERSILQCSVGNKSPIFLCSLIPNKIESSPLNLEFVEDDLIAFSVIGPHSIHLSGYFVTNEGNFIRDDYESDSFGEDIAETDTEDSSDFDTEDEYEDEYDDEFIDDEEDECPGLYTTSQAPNSGVVIEEIVDDEKSNDANGQANKVKKNKSSDSEDIRNSQRQIVLKRNVGKAVSVSEDEDGFPISTKSTRRGNIQKSEPEQEQKDQNPGHVKANVKDGNDASSLKRKFENDDQVDHTERKKKKKQKKKAKEEKARETGDVGNMGSKKPTEEVESEGVNQISGGYKNDKKLSNQRDALTSKDIIEDETHMEDKQKKTKKKKKNKETTKVVSKSDEVTKTAGDLSKSTLGSKEDSGSKSSQVRTFPNGLVIEEVAMGKPDGKRASPGNTVSVHYIGKLKNGTIFDSNVGRAPIKFRLGVGQVIKGWDVGINGMRIGDKRRLTIPPSMGYGAEGAEAKIPPNSWLIFDVELVAVR